MLTRGRCVVLLLAKLMTGELPVPDAERIIERCV